MTPVRLRSYRRKEVVDTMIGELHEGRLQDATLAAIDAKRIRPGRARHLCHDNLANRLAAAFLR